MTRSVAVVGAGWAGLAAAVTLARAGRAVTVFEMAPRAGGRARAVDRDGTVWDNGQHILIGAYRETLALMREVGADPDALLHRSPLCLRQPGRHGLRLPPGAAVPAFARGVLGQRDWPMTDRLALLAAAAGWAARRFRCPPDWTVDRLCARLPERLRVELIDPLCVAALNTPATEASAAVLLRVLRDALFGGRGGADLLLPRAPLDALLPAPARAWLTRHGAVLREGRRVTAVAGADGGWTVDGEPFDAVVLAASSTETARLAAPIDGRWAARAAALRHEPIVTAYVEAEGARLDEPMMALAEGPGAPAQFAFDLGALGRPAGRLAFVVSGAAPWVDRGRDAIDAALRAQARAAWPDAAWPARMSLRELLIEKRATFRCTPGLDRPPAAVAPGLVAAGDFVEGPYPATLEGAVRSGRGAARLLGA